ncbi:MAG: sensor histidine kinase [Lachnospiraceae bacterium]|nr:sensor histidine kinase [Lachnospiraceae bacterium]
MTLGNFYEDDIFFNIIRIILITSFTLGMMSSLTSFKYRPKRVLSLFALYLAWIAVSTGIIVYFAGFFTFARYMIFTISIPAIALAYAMDCNSPAQSVFNYATQVMFSYILAMTTLLINTAVRGSIGSYLLILCLMYTLVITLEYRFLRRPFLELTKAVEISWGSLSLIPVFFSVLLLFIANYPAYYTKDPIRILYLLGVLVLILVVYFFVYQSILRQYQYQMLAHHRDILTLQVSAMETQARNMHATEEKLKILRHDIRHFSNIMQVCLQDGSLDEARNMLSELETAVGKITVKTYCKDHLINSVLTFYLELAKSEGIHVQTAFAAPPAGKFHSPAFSIALANALENALNACKHEPGPRIIKLKSRMFSGQYLMELSNTCSKTVLFDKDDLPISHRGEGHGIGTKSILSFAKQAKAMVNFRQEGGYFILQVITQA